MSRLLLVLVTVSLVLMAACGGDAGGSAQVDLSGGLAVHAEGGGGTCGPSPDGGSGLLGRFPLDLGGLPYELRFLTDHAGAGTYTVSDEATFVALNGGGPGWSTLSDDAGTLVVNRDGRSGTLDVWLAPEPGTDNGWLHVVGGWHCPPAGS